MIKGTIILSKLVDAYLQKWGRITGTTDEEISQSLSALLKDAVYKQQSFFNSLDVVIHDDFIENMNFCFLKFSTLLEVLEAGPNPVTGMSDKDEMIRFASELKSKIIDTYDPTRSNPENVEAICDAVSSLCSPSSRLGR